MAADRRSLISGWVLALAGALLLLAAGRLLWQARGEKAAASLPTGPALRTSPVPEPGTATRAAAADPLPALEPAERLEWSGAAVNGPEKDERVVIRDPQAWLNFWPLYSAEPIPLLDFQKYMVVGIVAGPGPARLGEIAARDGKIVAHIGRRSNGEQIPARSFRLKALPRSDLPVEFSEKP